MNALSQRNYGPLYYISFKLVKLNNGKRTEKRFSKRILFLRKKQDGHLFCRITHPWSLQADLDTDPEIKSLRKSEPEILMLFRSYSDGTTSLLWILIKINKTKAVAHYISHFFSLSS